MVLFVAVTDPSVFTVGVASDLTGNIIHNYYSRKRLKTAVSFWLLCIFSMESRSHVSMDLA